MSIARYLLRLPRPNYFFLILVTFLSQSFALVAETPLHSIDEYNDRLPYWGSSWKPGQGAINGYYPSFYTGFAPRNADPNRVHVRTSRGNQTRVTVILDENTVRDYLFDLVARYEFYKSMQSGTPALIDVNPSGASIFPQLSYFNQVVESANYGILQFVQEARRGQHSKDTIYNKSFAVMKALNAKRVFDIRMDLKTEFNRWARLVIPMVSGKDPTTHFKNQPNDTIKAINTLLLGRVNYTEKPTPETLEMLGKTAQLAAEGSDFYRQAALLLSKLSNGKYDQSHFSDGNWSSAIQCESSSQCELALTEFTTIYPTGSAKSYTNDGKGNRISNFATPGLWPFINRSGGRGVDNIRQEAYYGWAPKMDFEAIGNGFHNPAVRHHMGPGQTGLKTSLNIPSPHLTFWGAIRGPISHGCLRLPLGHVWEMRHIFPVGDTEMTQIHQFGNGSKDFDLYDINGDGRPEIMGVHYFIRYTTQGEGSAALREGSGLDTQDKHRSKYYSDLYGKAGVYVEQTDGTLVFTNPSISLQGYMDLKQKSVKNSMEVAGEYPLYEQHYEQDKVQFYLPLTNKGRAWSSPDKTNKRFIRLMGRVRGCAPDSDKDRCGEADFQREARIVLPTVGRKY